jgi:hypothetical protein
MPRVAHRSSVPESRTRPADYEPRRPGARRRTVLPGQTTNSLSLPLALTTHSPGVMFPVTVCHHLKAVRFR